MLRTMLIAFFFISMPMAWGAEPMQISINHKNGDRFMDVRLMGMLHLDDLSDKGLEVGEMSGLVWSETSDRLYAVSNDGNLFHFQPRFDRNGILVDVVLDEAFPLLDTQGQILKGRMRDAEGLALIRKGKREVLAISFEGHHRIEEYDTTGHWLASKKLPPPLSNAGTFQSRNKGMEAITLHPEYGLITTSELPMSTHPADEQRFISVDGKHQWAIKRSDLPDASVVGLEVAPSGELMMLERSFENPLKPISTSLYRITLNPDCVLEKKTLCQKHLVARFRSDQEFNIDNFEGITRLGERGYLLMSDNNSFWLQRTLLTYLEVVDPVETEKGQPPVER